MGGLSSNQKCRQVNFKWYRGTALIVDILACKTFFSHFFILDAPFFLLSYLDIGIVFSLQM